MKALSRDTWLALSLFALLALITAAAAATQTRAAQLPPLSSRSNQPDGAHALFLWLDRLGYRADDGVSQGFDLPANTRAVLVLEPTQPILEDEWQVLDEWVEDGGVLVLAGAGFTSLSAMRHYDVGLRFLNEPLASAAAAAPLLLSPPLDEPAEVLAEAYLETNRSDYAVHIAAAPSKMAAKNSNRSTMPSFSSLIRSISSKIFFQLKTLKIKACKVVKYRCSK